MVQSVDSDISYINPNERGLLIWGEGEMSIGKRCKQIREIKNLTQNKLKEILVCQQSYVSAVEREVNEPSDHWLNNFGDKMNISTQWLKTGRGSQKRLRLKDELMIMEKSNQLLNWNKVLRQISQKVPERDHGQLMGLIVDLYRRHCI